jgi:hypothetical protein
MMFDGLPPGVQEDYSESTTWYLASPTILAPSRIPLADLLKQVTFPEWLNMSRGS